MKNKESSKTYTVQVGGKLTFRGNLDKVHEARWSSKEWGVLAAIIAIVGVLVALLVPSLSYEIRIALAAILLITLLVVTLNNKARYATIMFLRQLDQRLAATKTYGDDKKPANHND